MLTLQKASFVVLSMLILLISGGGLFAQSSRTTSTSGAHKTSAQSGVNKTAPVYQKSKYVAKPTAYFTAATIKPRNPVLLDSFLTEHKIDTGCMANRNLYNEVYQWYSTRYHWGGASKLGVDCAGFVFKLFNTLYGIDLPRSATLIFPLCRPLDECEEPQEGDLVFFNIKGRWLSHVGIYLQDGLFVHASVHSGVVISSLNEPYYKKYFYKFAKLSAPSAMLGDGL